jgi:hypothetical protein
MNVRAYTNHLPGFASDSELAEWSPRVRSELVGRILQSSPSADAWKSFLELLFLTPEAESVETIIDRGNEILQTWDWALRSLDYSDPVLRRDNGIAMKVVGLLVARDFEDLRGDTLCMLCRNPHTQNITGLRLYKVETFAKYIALIAQCRNLSRLEFLELVKVDLSRGVLEAFDEDCLSSLQELRLVDTGMSAADIRDLVRLSLCSNLVHLSLASNYVSTEDLGAILGAESLSRMEVLDLSHTFVHSRGLQQTVAARKLPALKKIILRGTPAAESFGQELRLGDS